MEAAQHELELKASNERMMEMEDEVERQECLVLMMVLMLVEMTAVKV